MWVMGARTSHAPILIYSLKSTVDHEAEKFINVFFLICYDLKFRDFSAGEDVCKRYILGKFGFEIQSVSFTCYQFYLTAAAIYYLEKFFNVFNIGYFHFCFSFKNFII